MNSTILARATSLIPDNELLVNMVRLRVRQLAQGARSMILAPPGMGIADIALSEIAAGKLASEPKLDPNAQTTVIVFPGVVPKKKAA